MSRLLSMLGVIATFLTFLAGSDAITTQILEPIRSTGDEVGLIFIPAFQLRPEQYNKTARAIQEASELRVWLAFTGEYYLNVVDAQQVQVAVEDAIRALQDAGMTSQHFVGVGHGVGGHFLQLGAKKSDLKAIVLMGSTLPREAKLQDFPIPVLTLAAELDGLTRITRIAEEYEKLTDDVVWGFFKGLYTTPVIFIEGANHAQFASGNMPPYIRDGDLLATEADEVVRRMIGQHVSNFLTATFGSDDFQITIALEELSEAFMRSVDKLQPFLDIKYLDTDGFESMWTILAQEFFAGDYSDRTAIYNDIKEGLEFVGQKPKVTPLGKAVIVGTAALVVPEKNTGLAHFHSGVESPHEISMKLVSRDAIVAALNETDPTSLKSEPNTCKTLNQLAMTLALSLSDEAAQDRYLAEGRKVIFEDDIVLGMNLLWAATPLKMWEDEKGLHVRSVAMVTRNRGTKHPGMHYCKVMSAYRAMEWLNVDSWRQYGR